MDTSNDYRNQIKKLGELRVDNILEIQYILKLIDESNMTISQKQQTTLCLSTLISLSNKYLKDNADLEKIKDTFVEVSESSESDD